MNPKSITIIKEDNDSVIVQLLAPSERAAAEDARSLLTEFDRFPNKGFSSPDSISPVELDSDGNFGCSFGACYPVRVAREIVEDWLKENAGCYVSDQSGVFSYN